MGLPLTYSAVADLFCVLHKIPEAGRVALRGRLQHLQKLKFPSGVNTGRGRPAQYGAPETVLIALALEMAQIGMPPERAISTLRRSSHSILTGMEHASSYLQSFPDDRDPDGDILLIFVPDALSDSFKAEEPRSGLTFMAADWKTFRLTPAQLFPVRFGAIQLTKLIDDVVEILVATGAIDERQDFLLALSAWAAEKLEEGAHHVDDKKA